MLATRIRKKKSVLRTKTDEPNKQGLLDDGGKVFEIMSCELNYIVKLRLDAGEPVDIEPFKVTLELEAVPIRSKQRRYPPTKRDFIARYVQELLKLGFVRKVTAAEWVSVPLVVSKLTPAMYRLTADYRSLNAVTHPMLWSMSDMHAELAETRRSKTFAGIEFCSGY